MSISVTRIVNLPQAALKFLVQDETEDEPVRDYKTIGGVLSDADYAWLASGPRLEIVNTRTGSKVGAWTFGWVLKDSSTEVVCVGEIQRPNGRLPLLAVGLDCDFSGGMICVFDFVTSKIIRAIHIKDKITTLHVIDAGYDVFTLPGPLRNFDGIIAVGTSGGNVFLVDTCRQICDEALTTGGLNEIRDELNPSLLHDITSKDLGKIEHQKEFAIRNSHHLAIHLNIVFDKSTKHFILKGPKGDDRIHVNKDEVTVSALYYCPQLGSLLVGYNFGALQLYNLMNLELVYTSPVCDEHIPISHFAIQEPADDPRSVCYVWAIYSMDEEYPTCLPLAVMYAFCYQTKEYHEGYGCLYQDFSSASVQYQMELGLPPGNNKTSKKRGGNCLKINSIVQGSVNREGPQHDSNEDVLTLCVFVWNVWLSKTESETFLAIFDLNQWYKEQMPNVLKQQYSSTYMLQLHLNDLINSSTNKSAPVLDIYTNKNSILQFTGAQRLEEHFYPNSITFGMTCLRENDIIFLHNYGVQKALLTQIESSGPLCLVDPAEIYQGVVSLGLVPLFIDLPVNAPISTNQQREIILGAALENHLMGWLCKCASEWANGSFLSAGCSLDLLISWAFQRAVTLKTNCDKFCTPLFDYSESRPDNNTNVLLNSCTRQLKNLYSLYTFVFTRLSNYVSNHELVGEQYKSLETVSVYFEVLQWLLNVGLLPECPLTAYPRSDDLERINAPYPAEMLIDFYNHRRALLKILNQENFATSESVLFIDALIERECGGSILQEQWRSDGGNGLYPPPSLQALLRTYLIDNVNLSYKHSVIIYVFLDLAMTLDQDRYKPVITHLIKFPAVFKVSPSVIKITQAFWQLDHSDYNTAMGLLLDPLVLSEDLSQWHHKVVLRALMLQKQHNYALLYVQVRKPVLKDDDDILTAISLYVANNMLDEAFYFEKHCSNQKQEDKFLNHLFNECKKNDTLKSLIYRTMRPSDENLFLTYLTNSKLSSAEDLHVYYHILRSHFIEAFESHERSVPHQIENQGLLGQENAIPRDKLVHTLKKLLPDVNRNLLSLCHKEKSNTWQQVSRPTPMSVFVHNVSENVHYKSTVIGAALAKAKQTFAETVKQKFKVETEGTPFLRTPTVTQSARRSSAVIVNPKVIDMEAVIVDYSSPPPVKRMKLSPRLNNSLSVAIPTKLDTPLVKRKTPKARDGTGERKVVTPQSILKVKSLINHTPFKNDGEFEDNLKEFEKIEYTPVPKKSGLGLSPRKSLPVVRFEGLKSASSSSLETSLESPRNKKTPEKISTSPTLNLDNNSIQLNSSSKNTSTEDEIFYSPDASLEEKVDKEITVPEIENTNQIDEKIGAVVEDTELSLEASVHNDTQEISEEKPKSSLVFSPTRRRSYKRSLGQTTPVRSSPRLSRNAILTNESLISSPQHQSVQNKESILVSKDASFDDSVKNTTSMSEKTDEKDDSVTESSKSESVAESPSVLPKLRARKSLCRKVLETNALNRVLNSPLDSPRSRRSKNLETVQVTNIEEVTENVVLESKTKFEDGEEIHHSTSLTRHNLTTSFLESDVDSSADVSIDYGGGEELPLSDSMQQYINCSYKTGSTRNSLFENSDMKEISFRDISNNDFTAETSLQSIRTEPNKTLNDDKERTNEVGWANTTEEVVQDYAALQDTIETKETKIVDNISESESTCNTSKLKEKDAVNDDQSKNIIDGEILHNKSVTFDGNSTVNNSKSLVYSVLDSSVDAFSMSYDESGPKLSDSMIRCINDNEQKDHDVEEIKDEEIEVMEVDEEVEVIEEIQETIAQNKSDELVYTTLRNSELNETETKANSTETVFEESAVKENKVQETFDVESDTNRPIDPGMNVFEVSDDLSFNDGLVIEKEVTLEENDLCYGQQNTLENVLQENIRGVSSTPLTALEKNVFNESYCSYQESVQEKEIDQEEPDVYEENVDTNKEAVAEDEDDQEEPDIYEENEDINRETDEDKQPENEVIEIGSSSDDEENNKSKDDFSSSESPNSSDEDESDDEKLDVSYERNIYDSEEDSCFESNDERHYSEISENSDDDQVEEGCGLFEGDIVYLDDEEDERNRKNKYTTIGEQIEKESTGSENRIRKQSDEDMLDESVVQEDKQLSNEVVEEVEVKAECDKKINNDENEIILHEDTCSEQRKEKGILTEDNIEKQSNDEEMQDDGLGQKDDEPMKETVQEHTEVRDGRKNIDNANNITSHEVSMSDGRVTKFSEKGIPSIVVEKPTEKMECGVETSISDSSKEPKLALEDTDVSVDMDELSYSIHDERSISEKDGIKQGVSMKEEPKKDAKEGNFLKDSKVSKEKEVEQSADEMQDDTFREQSPEKDKSEQTIDAQDTKVSEETIHEVPTIEDPFDTIDSGPSEIKRNLERDILDSTHFEEEIKSRTRSASASSSIPAKSERSRRKKSESVSEEIPKLRKSNRKTKDILEDLNMNTPKREPDVLGDLLKTVVPGRTLRTRRGSTEENVTPTVTLRKRSASVDDTKLTTSQQSNEKESVSKKDSTEKRRNRRASSVLNLPKIPEEDDTIKKSKSVVEGYSMSRRVTRQQLTLLKKIEGVKYDLEYVDPIVLLDKVPFEGKPDPEEQNVYDSSPSTTNSTSSTPVKPSRRLRSVSQTSERSKSKTPVRTIRSKSRQKSTDEENTSKKNLKDIIENIEENLVSSEPRMTRSRAKSVSSVNSDDSTVSADVNASKKRQRRVSQSTLPKIQEEPATKEKSPVPKKRTRKNSSQI